jgi:hypothetical protein
MHFQSDDKFLELTKILEIKNKGNNRESVPIFRSPKWHFPKIFLVSVLWNTLVQMGVKVRIAKIDHLMFYLFTEHF